MKLREIMTPDPLTLTPRHTVGEVISIFMDNKINGAPVLDKAGKLIGLFTKSHIYRAINKGMDLSNKVETLMTHDIITGHPDDEFGEVVNPTVTRLPVVDKDGKVVGIITRGDIAKAFFHSYRNLTLEYDTIINSAHNMIVSIDEKGLIKIWNSSAARLLGMEADDVIGKNILEVLPTSGLMDIIETRRAEPFMKVKLNNRYFISNRSPIMKEGRIIGAVAVLLDISDVEKMSKEMHYVNELNEELDAISRGDQLGDASVSSAYIIVSGIIPLKDAVESVEKQLLEKVYTKYRTTRQMAKVLKVDASTIVRKAAKYHIAQTRSSEL